MMLKIRNVGPMDFGSYKCVAKNSLGETDGVIRLEGKSSVTYSKIVLNFSYLFLHIEIPVPTSIRTTAPPPSMTSLQKGKSFL